MRLRGGRDIKLATPPLLAPAPPTVSWLPGVLTKGVRLRLRLDRHGNQGRDSWHLVDLDAEMKPIGRRLRSQGSITCSSGRMNSEADMETPDLSSQFIASSIQGKVPGRKRGRPPIRKLDFESCYAEPLTPIKIPKKRGRKPGFKLKPRMLLSPLANSPPNSTPEPEMGSLPQDAALVPHSATPQVLTAETATPGNYLCDPVESKRYSHDPSDSAFSLMSPQYNPKRTFGFRSTSCPTPVPACRQASSPRCFQECHRNGYSSVREAIESKRPSDKPPSSWSVEEVVWFIQDADPQALGPHADTFRKHEIDGDALLLLKSEMMMKYLGLKLGPALKLCYHIDKLKQSRS
ncbi:hypothetical protein WMY93_015446 [Mugilogobius chulae]|uniref:SAM domain-containing protein n=1 Tax=Mugilogobius chulae TaxID=88201 RepID=A0AAW0NUR9_9GOBI